MARETTTRGRSELARHDARLWTCITRLRPTWRGVWVAIVAATLVVVEIVTGDTALLLVLVVVAVPFVVSPVMVLGRAQRGEGVEVHLMIAPPVVPVGAPSRLLVQLSRSGAADGPPLSLDRPSEHWRVGIPSGPPAAEPPAPPFTLAPEVGRLIRWDRLMPDEHASATLSLPTGRRGVFTIGPLRLWVHDPFALFGLTVATARPVMLVVHPPAVVGTTPPAARPGWSGSTQFGDGPAGAHSDDPGGEWSGLRPYEPGDRLHLLSWQAEGRFGSLLVHDFRPESEDVVSVVLDDRALVHRRDAFERALGVVYGFVSTAGGRAADYDVSTLSGRRVRGSTTPEGLVALMTFLAEVRPTRSSLHALPSAAALSLGAPVITTPTAAPSLPLSLHPGSVVVVE